MPTDRSIARQHADWLSLMEVSGPFLSMPVLLEAFPQGLDVTEDESELRRRLRLAHEEWADNQEGHHPETAIHTQWLRFVLEEVLSLRSDTLLEGQTLPPELSYEIREHGETLRPLLAIRSPYEKQTRLLIQLYPKTQPLEKVLPEKHWKASPATRMMELLRNTNIRLGLITNGEQWMLIDAPTNETTGYYSWYSTLWLDEPLTLQAFRSLLSMERFFNVPEDETLEALLTKSALKQQEVTDQLGDQVRRAVDTLVRTLDRLDKDSQRTLLHSITEKDLYEAALTVMMRLVFLLSAEERDMLLLGDPLYDQNYAVSSLLKQLRDLADQHGEEVLGLRYDAWSRLLATFRIVYGGIEYPDLRLPAYGGNLFDPDRFPFLEGRALHTTWRDNLAYPLAIDNRTVLHLLGALQYLQVRVPGGSIEPRRLSFRGLDIEQIGHVYEGLLDHTAKRAPVAILGLTGTSDTEPEVTLDELEQHASKGEQELLSFLQETTKRSATALKKSLAQTLEKQEERSRLMEVCDNQPILFERLLPFSGLLRKDTFDNYVLVTPGSVYVTKGSDRRSTGTHYTPRSLTEPIVQHTLDPLVYIGPAEGLPPQSWQLRSAAEILDLKVCDMAMGSGAFLVQTCRYLSEKLVEAWENAEQQLHQQNASSPIKPQITPTGHPSSGQPAEELLPIDTEERLALARRLIAERCLYGVDKNPMAVEMAKLSLWLITLAKNRPFTFVDHALRSGDSLLGADERQLANWSMDAKSGEISQMAWIRGAMEQALPKALKLRRQISALHEQHVRDVEAKERMLKEADEAMAVVKLGADLLVGMALTDSKRRKAIEDTLGIPYLTLVRGYEDGRRERFTDLGWENIRQEFVRIRVEVDALLKGRKPFHWPLEFPEVFVGKGHDAGFAAIVSNPPFQGGSKISGTLGADYREYLVDYLAHGKRGNADLCAFFFLRILKLVRKNGMSSLLATNTIAQGDTREVGLDQLLQDEWMITRAIASREWPGDASLQIACIWLNRGNWHGSYILEDKAVKGITPFLTPIQNIQGVPHRLITNLAKSFNGSKVYGQGFVLKIEEAKELIQKDSRNKDILYPYLNGEDLNFRPDQSPSRWIINFRDWPLKQAETYLDCMKIVREKVKPERDLNNRKIRRERWWQYAERAPTLYSTIADMRRVLVRGEVSSHSTFSWRPTSEVFSHMLIVWATEQNYHFTLLQSSIHTFWTIEYASTLGKGIRYTPTDCFETFPFPNNTNDLNDIGEHYYTHRQSIMLTRQEGLTKTYNRFHDPKEKSPDILQLRQLHTEMDEAVAHAYAWDDLQLEHGFHDTKQGLRYTISEPTRREVLDRLLLLNHQRHAEEVQAGLFDKSGKPTKNKKNPADKNNTQSHSRSTIEASPEITPIEGEIQQGTLF